MKKTVYFFIGTFFLIFTLTSCAQEAKSGKTETVKISASMHCQDCADNITEKLNSEPGVRKVHADPETKVVEIEYNPKKTDPEKLAAVIRDLGYTASVVIE